MIRLNLSQHIANRGVEHSRLRKIFFSTIKVQRFRNAGDSMKKVIGAICGGMDASG